MIRKLDEYQVIGIVGLAKNTGKTTTLNWLIKKFNHENLGLTSIGLDGEKMDQIHFLPKPRIRVYKQMIVATAASCLNESNVHYEILNKTNLFTPIGEILVVRMLDEAELVIAGPTTNTELASILRMMKTHVSRIFVDGAFNRMTFSNLDEIDGIILATGAAVSPLLEETVELTKNIVNLFNLQKSSYEFENSQAKIVFVTDKDEINLLDKKITSIEKIVNNQNIDIKRIYVKGAISEQLIDTLIQSRRKDYELIGEDASKFIFHHKRFKHLNHLHVTLRVQKICKLIFLTMNPYRPTHQSYNSEEFMKALKENIDLETIDVMRKE